MESALGGAWSPRMDQRYCECDILCNIIIILFNVFYSKQMLQKQSIGARMLTKHIKKEEVAKKEGS